MSSEQVLVDPDLQTIIRTASAPAASAPKVKPPREMPGDGGFLDGVRHLAGVLVMPMIGGIGRHPRWWKDPDTFDPSRFSPERAEDRQHPAIYLPFGAGAHACVGMQLANMEVKLFWHKLLSRCSFTLEKDYDAKHTIPPLGVVSGKVSLRLEPITPPARPAPTPEPAATQ